MRSSPTACAIVACLDSEIPDRGWPDRQGRVFGALLSAKHLRQAEMYAVNEGVEWIVLTNAARWQAYHLTGGLPVVIDLAVDVDLPGDEPTAHKVDQLFYLTRESLKRRQIDELWQAKRVTSPASLAQVLVSEPVAEAIAKSCGAGLAIGSTLMRSLGC
jgi:hypothetical protein